jgi:hypothetical protein
MPVAAIQEKYLFTTTYYTQLCQCLFFEVDLFSQLLRMALFQL